MLRVPLLPRAIPAVQSGLVYDNFSSDEKEFYNRFYDEAKENIEKLHTLEFFVYLRDGTRVPVKELASILETNSNVFIENSWRLITVVEAKFPGTESYYWRQAFYLSSGSSSDMPGTWLPFDGICTRGGKGGTLWYKKAFTGGDRILKQFGFNSELNKKILFERFFEYIYLPESYGPLADNETLPLFDRFGTYSYLLASYSLGGNHFKDGSPTYQYSNERPRTLNTDGGIRIDAIEEIIMTPSPMLHLQITKKDTDDVIFINNYIDRHKASSWHQAFRPLNVPTLNDLSSTMPEFSYTLPHETILNKFIDVVHGLYYQHRVNGMKLEEIQEHLVVDLDTLHKTTDLIRGDLVSPPSLGGLAESTRGVQGGKSKSKKTRKSKKISKKSSRKTKLRKLQTRR